MIRLAEKLPEEANRVALPRYPAIW